MDTLIKLVNIFSSKKLKSKGYIHFSDKKSKLYLLYDGIRSKTILSDTDAKNLLYPSITDSNAYPRLKSSLKKKLQNAVVAIDLDLVLPDKDHNYWSSYVKKELYKITILKLYGISPNISNLHKLLDIATTNHFHTTAINIGSILFKLYTYRKTNLIEAKNIGLIIQSQIDDLKIERLVIEKYSSLISHYTQSKSKKFFIATQADEYLKEFENIKLSSESASFIAHYYGIWLIKYMSLQDYENANLYGEIALKKLDQLPYNANIQKGFFLSNLIICDIGLKEFKRGNQRIEILNSNKVKGSSTWFNMNEVGVALGFYTKNYDSSYSYYSQTINEPSFDKLSTPKKDKWYTIEAYLSFLVLVDKLTLPENDNTSLSNFKVDKYFSRMEIYNKDKKGFYITIWIGYLINLIATKEFDILFLVEEAFSKYVSRYLSKENNFRTLIFSKMLIVLIKSSFDTDKIEKKINRYLEKLKGTPPLLSNQEHDIEIIPYEDLWEMVIELC